MNDEPVVLLPLRLETRSDGEGRVLRIRVFPDDIHVEALDTGITDEEKAAGEAYWQAVWTAGAADEGTAAAWSGLLRVVGPRRASWVAEALQPTNLDQRPATPPVFPDVPARTNPPARTRMLPTRFHAYAVQGTAESTAQGEPVRVPLQVGPPTAAAASPMAFVNGVPVVAKELRWLVDFEEAKAAGMGLVLQLAVPHQLVDELVVVGLRDDLDPATASARLVELFRSHAYTTGAAFVPQGSPTNNTETDRSEWSRRMLPPQPGTVDPQPGSNADVLGRALDVPTGELAVFDHAGEEEQVAARAMATALWPSTWDVIFGKLTHPATPGRSFTLGEQDALRAHAIGYVRGRGPVPALRIGRQPYGVLPTTSYTHGYVPFSADITDAGLSQFLAKARQLWRAGVADIPTVMDGDPEQALPEILGSSPVLVGLRVRSLTQVNKCYEPTPFLLHTDDNCVSQEGVDQIAREFLGFDPTEVQSTGLLGKASRVLALPLTDDSDLAYIAHLLDPDTNAAQDSRSVLQALLGLGAATHAEDSLRAAGDDGLVKLSATMPVVAEVVDTQLLRNGLEAVSKAHVSTEAAQLVDRAALALTRVDGFVPLNRGALAAAYPLDAVRPAALVTAATRGDDVLLQQPKLLLQLVGEVFRVSTRRREFNEALTVLSHVTSKEDRALLLAEVLDTASHRLDAWLTSLATSRLDRQRSQGMRGVILGGYGIVRNIPISPPAVAQQAPGGLGTVFVDRHDGGYVHAPSLDHAATAGVLRSARLTHDPGDTGSPALNIDLSSTRVRMALHVLDGVRQGQPLGALLGYRLERWLHERSGHGLELDRYLYVLRSIAPLTAAKLTDHGAEPVPIAVESVATPNVVDGVRLLEIFTSPTGPATIGARLESGPDEATLTTYLADGWPTVPTAEKNAVLDAIGELEQVHDAIADVLLAEAVHHLVQGNTAGAAAALDAAGGGDGIPPDPQVVRTPRSGTAFTHRLLALTPRSGLGGSSGWSDDAPRATAYPQLEAWARVQLGPAARFVLRVQPEVTLAGHGLCALDVVLDAGPVLVERLGVEPVALRPGQWKRGTDHLILAEAEHLARSLRDVLAGARPVTGATLAAPTDVADPPRAMDLAGLHNRATAARDGLVAKQLALGLAQNTARLAQALTNLYAYGVRPPAPVASLLAADLHRAADAVAHEVERRVGAANAALDSAATAADRAQAARAAASAATSASEAAAMRLAAASLDLEQLRALGDGLTAVFGPGLPALPDVAPPGAPDPLTASLAVAGPTGAGQIRPWLSRWASVRRSVGRHAETLLFREALGARPTLRVAQLGLEPTADWIGLPFAAAQPPKGPVVSLVIELPQNLMPTGHETLSGFVVDEWVDVVPRRIAVPDRGSPGAPDQVVAVATTAVAVNGPAPSARPPQAVLLAVTPDGLPWTSEKLRDVVRDTFQLAQERAVTLERVPLAPRIVPALYVDDWSLQGEADPVLFVSKMTDTFHVNTAVPKFVGSPK